MSILSSRPDVLGINPAVVEPRPDEPRAAAVAAVHAAVDRRTRAFADATGIGCPPGCGQCCLSPNVETTVAELLPLAEHVVQTGRADEILDRIDTAAAAEDTRCVLFDADSDNPTRGRCSMYAHRPSLCRLFGFAGRRDADDRPEFSPCWIHGHTQPEQVAAARAEVHAGNIALPLFTEATMRVNAAAPNLDGRPQPINAALRRAIQSTGLSMALRSITVIDVMKGRSDRGDDDLTPPTPHIPPSRAA